MSDKPDAAEAGATAAGAALAKLEGARPALAIVYASITHDLPRLLSSIKDLVGEAPVVGATSAGHFADGQVHGLGTGVAVLILAEGPYRFGVASVAHIGEDLEEAGRDLARTSRAAAGPAPHGAVLLFTDWLIGDQQQLIHGIYKVTGPRVPIVGGAAGDDMRMGPTLVFRDEQVLEQAAVAIWIASERPLRVGTRHGWVPVGLPLLVGSVEGTDLRELGGQPAAAAYANQLELGEEILSTQEGFFPVGLRHPLAIVQSDGSLLVRAVIGKTPSGSLTTTSHVPAGSAVHVTVGSPDGLLSCIEPLAADLQSGDGEASVALVFSCIARAMILGDRIVEEPARLHAAAGDMSTFGFWTYGEYGRTRGVLGTHNATLTAIAL